MPKSIMSDRAIRQPKDPLVEVNFCGYF
jgi:hypothetical protein